MALLAAASLVMGMLVASAVSASANVGGTSDGTTNNYSPSFPISVTLTVIGGNLVLSQNAGGGGTVADAGACVDFGLEGLCAPATTPTGSPISFTGTIAADGTLTVPNTGVFFPASDPIYTPDVSAWVFATVAAPSGVSGTVDPETGTISLDLGLTFTLQFVSNGSATTPPATPGDGTTVGLCTLGVPAVATDTGVGTAAPSDAQVTTWPDGQPYDPGTGVGRGVDSTFATAAFTAGDGITVGTCDSAFLAGAINGSLALPNSNNYIGLQFQSTPILLPPPTPTVQVNAVTQDSAGTTPAQVVTNAARDGNWLQIGGPFWTPSSTVAISICDDAAGTTGCNALGNVSSDTNGDLSGAVQVSGASTGMRYLFADNSGAGESDSIPFLVLDVVGATAPNSGPAGGTIAVQGTNWNPGSPSTVISFLDGTNTPIVDGSLNPIIYIPTVDGNGGFTQNVTIPDGTAAIAIAETDLGYPDPQTDPLNALLVVLPFTINQNQLLCDGSPLANQNGGGDCSLDQVVQLDVSPGVFTFSQAGGVINMDPITLDGTTQTSTGALNTGTLIDARGTNAGWDLSIKMTDLVDSSGMTTGNHRIDARNMEWVPTCTVVDPTATTFTSPPFAQLITLTTGSAAFLTNGYQGFCSAPVDNSGGTFTADADLTLTVPPNVYADTYTATITMLAL